MKAGVFSYVVDLIGSEVLARTPIVFPGNSQTMRLLEATRNADPEAGRGGGDITIVGGTALLSESGPSGTIADIIDSETTSDQISVYIVREGDTLSGIAKMFGVSVNTIAWANSITGGRIRPGDTLTILPITGVQHVIKKGETLAGIAKRYKGDLKEILRFNDLSEDAELTVGMVVTVPDGEVPAPTVSSSRGSVVRGTNVPEYAGYYMRPIVGGRKTQGLHGYNGVDLATYAGAPIYASAAGTVIIAKDYGYNGGYGVYLVIAHDNGTQTLYAHNNSNAVVPGQRVAQGQIVGYVGSTGKSTGSHIHFEIRGARNPF